MKYTPAQCRAAFYKAAARIEAHPEEYDFRALQVGKPGCPTCMWGHVGRVTGCDKNTNTVYGVPAIFGFDHDALTVRFSEFNAKLPYRGFVDHAHVPARLRAFADKHWPEESVPFHEMMRQLGAEETA